MIASVPFVGDRAWKLLPFRARWREGDRDVEALVEPGEDSAYVVRLDDREVPIDEEDELLSVAPPGATVTIRKGEIELEIWREGPHVRARAACASERGQVRTEPSRDIEAALVALGSLAPHEPRHCFFCTHSDYEPSTGFGGGHLACFVADAEAYDLIARSQDPRERKWGMWRDDLAYRWVDEFYVCEHWRRRPPGHGYRG